MKKLKDFIIRLSLSNEIENFREFLKILSVAEGYYHIKNGVWYEYRSAEHWSAWVKCEPREDLRAKAFILEYDKDGNLIWDNKNLMLEKARARDEAKAIEKANAKAQAKAAANAKSGKK